MANDVVRRVRTEKEIIYKSGFPMVNPKIRHAALPSPPLPLSACWPALAQQVKGAQRGAMQCGALLLCLLFASTIIVPTADTCFP